MFEWLTVSWLLTWFFKYWNFVCKEHAADNDRTTVASAERSRSPGVRTRAKGACYSMPSATALVTTLVDDTCLCAPSAGGSSSSCACTRSFVTTRRSTWRIPFVLSVPADPVPVYPVGTFHWLYALPRLRTKFGERAFSHAGPSAWNALSEDIRATSDSVVFRRSLKLIILA